MTIAELKRLHLKVGTVEAIRLCRSALDIRYLCLIALADKREGHGLKLSGD